MAFVVAKGIGTAVEMVDAGGVARNLTDNWVSGGPSLKVNSVEVTTIADSSVRRKLALQDHSFSLTLLYDNTSNKSWDVVRGRWAEDVARDIIFYPEGKTSGKPRITIPVLVVGVRVGESVGERVTLEVDLESDGVATIDTVP